MGQRSPLQRSPPRHWYCLALLLLLVNILTGCSSEAQSASRPTAACTALTQQLIHHQETFLTQARAIRGEHIFLREYDRQMVAAITSWLKTLQSTSLTALGVEEEVAGCSGEDLSELRREAHEEMQILLAYLKAFRRALKWDPDGVYIDEPGSL